MNRKSIKYRDTWAAPGSDLYDAIERKDNTAAEDLYWESQLEYLRFNGTAVQLAYAQAKVAATVARKKAEAEAAAKVKKP